MTTPLLDQRQIALVQAQWADLAPYGDDVADLYFRNLFDTHPELQPIFSADPLDLHRQRFVATVQLAIGALDRFPEVRPTFERSGGRCAAAGLSGAQYDLLGANLIKTLGDALEGEFALEARIAWTRAYALVAEAMAAAERIVDPFARVPLGA